MVVVKCLILCSKFGKKLFVGRAEESGDGRAGRGVQDSLVFDLQQRYLIHY